MIRRLRGRAAIAMHTVCTSHPPQTDDSCMVAATPHVGRLSGSQQNLRVVGVKVDVRLLRIDRRATILHTAGSLNSDGVTRRCKCSGCERELGDKTH